MQKKPWAAAFICLALTGATLAAYCPVFHCGFINFDDPDYVTANPMVRHGLTLKGLIWAFTGVHASNWHPLTSLSHMLDCHVFGLTPHAHHTVNLLLHIGNSVLLFCILKQISGAFWRSAFVGMVFALHPMHVESVAWISERKDVLSTFFGLLSIWFYVRYVQKDVRVPMYEPPPADATTQPFNSIFLTSRYYLISLFFFASSLLSKPMLVTLPFVLLLIDYWPLNRIQIENIARLVAGPKSENSQSTIQPSVSQKSTIFKALRPSAFSIQPLTFLDKLPFFALSFVSCVITSLVQHKSGAFDASAGLEFSERIGNAAVSYLRYVGKLAWPEGLAVYYPYHHWPIWQAVCAALVLAALTALALTVAARRPYAVVGWLWFLGTLVPVIGLVQVGAQSIADRYSYVPSIGLFVIVAWGAYELRCARRSCRLVMSTAGACALAVLGALTFYQCGYWRDNVSLYEHALAVTTGNAMVHKNLGFALLEDKMIPQAETHFRAAVQSQPEYWLNWASLGSVLKKSNAPHEAEICYSKAIMLRPNSASLLCDRAAVLEQLSKPEQAAADYLEALRLEPHCLQAHNRLASMLEIQGKLDEAIEHLRAILHVCSDAIDIRFRLASVLVKHGRIPDACNEYREIVRLNPQTPEILNNVAWILATDSENKIRNGPEAVRLAERACALRPQMASYYDTLAAALAEAGRMADAAIAEQKAIVLAESAGSTNSIPSFRERLESYSRRATNGKPQP